MAEAGQGGAPMCLVRACSQSTKLLLLSAMSMLCRGSRAALAWLRRAKGGPQCPAWGRARASKQRTKPSSQLQIHTGKLHVNSTCLLQIFAAYSLSASGVDSVVGLGWWHFEMKQFGSCLAVTECRNDLQAGLIAFRKTGVDSDGPDQSVCALQKFGRCSTPMAGQLVRD